jgi:hypothetical protein
MSLMDTFLEEDVVVQTAKWDVHIAIRRDGPPDAILPDLSVPLIGDGSPENPYDGSTRLKLDFILNPVRANAVSLPNTRFVFGPGIFRTEGGHNYARPTPSPWQVLQGQ